MLAFYLRLSKADKDTEESNSIQSQRELLQQSLSSYGLFKEEIVEYIDDGYSGKNFDRPGIKQLFSDVENGRIQVILVKDFSRFGRNYREVSTYLEKEFPERGIRFIAVNNGYDNNPNDTVLQNMIGKKGSSLNRMEKDGVTDYFQNENVDENDRIDRLEKERADKEDRTDRFQEKRVYGEGGISIFQNILDDYYSEDSSCKIKQALLQRKKEGKYLAPFAPYGYKKDKKQDYLVIDEEAAEIVKLIFQMRCEGKSGGEIARYLNDKKISSPCDYKNGKKREHIWQSEVIWSILRNREYLGNLVARKYETIQTGSKKRRKLPSDQWIEIEAAHMAIIEKDTFEYAQITGNNLTRKERKKAGISSNYNLKGIVLCGGCRHRMKRKGEKNPRFFCKYYYYDKNPLCIKSGIKEEQLFQIIQKVLEKMIDGFSRLYSYQQYQICCRKKLKRQNRKREKLEKRRKAESYFLYEKWKSGRITQEDYKKKIEEWEQNKKGIQRKEKRIQEVEESIFFAGFFREILLEILVTSLGKIQIRFRIKCR